MKSKKTNAALRLLFACSLVLLTATVYRHTNKAPGYKVEVFEPEQGRYGYKITSDGRTIISQPFVPGLQRVKYFTCADDARKVGALVKKRLESGDNISVSEKDLQSLSVTFFAD